MSLASIEEKNECGAEMNMEKLPHRSHMYAKRIKLIFDIHEILFFIGHSF